MYSFDEALAHIREWQARIVEAETRQRNYLNSSVPLELRNKEMAAEEETVARLRGYQQEVLQTLLRFPPHKGHHFQNVREFHKASPFDRAVLIMTKFPSQQGTALDHELGRVIKAVRDAVGACGHRAHLASDKTWREGLWDNVETYLMACGKAVAIVESKYTPELNPNVTMEWGWLRGTERRVLFLVERTFQMDRADLKGLIQDQFDWGNPEPDILAAVSRFLA